MTDERLELVRELVVDAGLEVLDRDGLGLQAESISYAKVFNHLGGYGVSVGRGSVHGRIWDSHDEFRTEVITAAATSSAPLENTARFLRGIAFIMNTIDEANPGLDRQGRIWGFCRMAGHALFVGARNSDSFLHFQAIKAAAGESQNGEAGRVLRAAVKVLADGNHENRVAAFRFLFEALGLRGNRQLGLSDDEAIDLFVTMVQVLVSGAHLDYTAGFEAMGAPVETDLPASDGWPWTYLGFGLLAGFETFFEPDPDGSPGLFDPPDGDLAVLRGEEAPLLDIPALIVDKPRRSREELKELVLAAGVELLLRDGVSLQAESLSYASVFGHIRATRGITVHRSTVHPELWSSQDEFRADVLAHAALTGSGETLSAIKQAMAAQPVTRNPDGSLNHRQTILDNTRAAVVAQMSVAQTSRIFRRWQSIKALLLTRGDEPEAELMRKAVRERYELLIEDSAGVFERALPPATLQINPELKLDDDEARRLYTMLATTVSTGSDFNVSAGATRPGENLTIPRVDGSGKSDEWPVQAAICLAIFDLVFVSTEPEQPSASVI